MEDYMELNRRFESVPVTDEQENDIDVTRAKFQSLAQMLDIMLPKGRYKSLCLTALEEACMWANKAISNTE